MSQQGSQIGVTGNAFSKGIPAVSLIWTGISGTVHSVSIHNSFRKQPIAEVSDSHGNMGEWLASRRRNKGYKLQIESKPVSTTMALARAIAADPPRRMDLVSIAGATDTSINSAGAAAPGTIGTPDYIVDSDPEVSYSPENESILSLTIKVYLADDDSHIVPVALSDT